jgi:hypothetical protein
VCVTYTLNVGAHNFIEQTLLDKKEQIGPDIIIVDDLNTLLSSIASSSRQKKSTKKL